MEDPSDEIDEVALNVLLAEGVDFPTALEASRRGSNSSKPGCAGFAMLTIIAPLAVAALLL